MQRAATLERRPNAAYDDDVVEWADAQAALLREGRFGEIDLANIIEEIDGVGGSQRAALASQIARVVHHLLKLIYSPAVEPRQGWINSIDDARLEIRVILDFSPSLRRTVDATLERSRHRDAQYTVRRLQSYGELDRDTERAVLDHRFTAEEILEDWWPSQR